MKDLVASKTADPCVGSRNTFDSTEQLLRNCESFHSECTTGKSQLPTRVLAINGSTSAVETLKLYLSRGEEGRYAALSYCWGSTPQTKLLKDNIKRYIKAIAVGSLPQTLQDAVHVAAKLKMSYIWVDSLCIIQDSDEDKAKEIAAMPRIYKHAAVTISAAVATDCGQGFLQDRRTVSEALSGFYSLPLTLQGDSSGTVGTVHVGFDGSLGFDARTFSVEPVNARAWTLQEVWLSRRMIVYGIGPPSWRCLHHIANVGQDGPAHHNKSFDGFLEG